MSTMTIDTDVPAQPCAPRRVGRAGPPDPPRPARGVPALALVLALRDRHPGAPPARSPPSEAGTPEPTRVVTVGTGDTLWAIAADLADDGDVRAMMTQIERLNALESGMLSAGQRLVVPPRLAPHTRLRQPLRPRLASRGRTGAEPGAPPLRPSVVEEVAQRPSRDLRARGGLCAVAGYSGTPLAQQDRDQGRATSSSSTAPPTPRPRRPAAPTSYAGCRATADVTLTFHTSYAALDHAGSRAVRAHRRPPAWSGSAGPRSPRRRRSASTSDLDENLVRDLGLELGFVDVKVAAIDDTWSGLKFVRRLADR